MSVALIEIAESHPGLTELMRWSFYGVPEAMSHLIQRGAEINARGPHHKTALFYAVESEKPLAVTVLIAAGADPNAKSDEDDWTPLMVAAFAEPSGTNLAIIKSLIAAGADVNARSSDDGTPVLMLAARRYNLQAVNSLIAAGADPTATNNDGESLLACAKAGRRQSPRMKNYLRQLESATTGRSPATAAPATPQDTSQRLRPQAALVLDR